MNPARLLLVGFVLVVVGFFVVAMGTISGAGSASSGGFILIGPIPIIFGSGPDSGTLSSVAVAVSVVMVAVYLASFLLWRSGRRKEAETERASE